MFNKIIKYTLYGVVWGCLVSTVINAVGSSILGLEWFAHMPYGYSINLLFGMIVGVGWTLPALIYQNEKLSMLMQTLFHMSIGFAIFIPCAFFIGWIPVEEGIGTVFTTLLGILLFSVALWGCFYLYSRVEAKKINQRIKEMNH